MLFKAGNCLLGGHDFQRISAGIRQELGQLLLLLLNLWLQPVSGGSPTRLTDGTEDDHQPAFSPDGARIVFRSERDGGGVYTVASTGGAPQLLVKGGRDPRFSPDGRWISYWSGDPLQPRGASVWVIASSGGQPVQILPEFADARYPVWAPDGKRLLFVIAPQE